MSFVPKGPGSEFPALALGIEEEVSLPLMCSNAGYPRHIQLKC